MAVISATRRLKALEAWCSRCSGFGSSTSATGGRPLADLVSHGLLAGLEGRHQSLGLLLEQLAALVEPLAGLGLGLAGEVLSALGHVAAARGEQLPGLAARARGREVRGGGAHHRAEEEPAEVACRVAAPIT